MELIPEELQAECERMCSTPGIYPPRPDGGRIFLGCCFHGRIETVDGVDHWIIEWPESSE